VWDRSSCSVELSAGIYCDGKKEKRLRKKEGKKEGRDISKGMGSKQGRKLWKKIDLCF
jgi:hypothetical protein